MPANQNIPVHLDGMKSPEVVQTLIQEEIANMSGAEQLHPEHRRALDCETTLRPSIAWPGRYSLRVVTDFGGSPEHVVSACEVIIPGFALRELRDKINDILHEGVQA